MNISARWCASASPPLEAAVHKRRRFLAAALGSVAAAALPGCYTIHETPPGGVRLHGDVFHTLLKVELLDQHAAALIELRKRFGPQAALRKALLKLPQESSRPARQTGDIPSERS